MAKTRDRRGLEFWKAEVLAWRKSGQTQREYCRQRRLSLYSLQSWSRRIPGGIKLKSKRARRPRPKKFALVRLSGNATPVENSGYELTLASGRKLTLPLNCDVLHVAALVTALEGAR